MSTTTEPHDHDLEPATSGKAIEPISLRAPGKFTAGAAEQLAASALATPLDAGILLDLTAVESLSLEAAAVLMRLAHHCHTENRPFAVTVSAAAHRKLTLLGLDAVLALTRPS